MPNKVGSSLFGMSAGVRSGHRAFLNYRRSTSKAATRQRVCVRDKAEPFCCMPLELFGIFSIYKIIGNTRTVSGAWTTFALKTMIVSFSSATVAGLTTQMACAPFFGPVMPFLIGSTIGFAGGMAHRWYFDRSEALYLLDTHPEVMKWHLYMLGPGKFHKIDYDTFKARARTHVYEASLAIAAMYGAADVLHRIRQEKEDEVFRVTVANFQSQLCE